LLQDNQVAFARGERTIYIHQVIRIQTPQGLGAGNISFPWRPGTDMLTIHTLLIRRGDQVIDVLASGQTFSIVRREANLESAMLDGVLTANIQPEGLQVGDQIEVAASLTTRDPVTPDHVEFLGQGWDSSPLARAHFSMQWPDALPIRIRQGGGLPTLRPIRRGGTTSVNMTLDDVRPLTVPNGAPPRFAIGRVIEATDLASWAELAALMAPLYETASRMPEEGPLQTELARIRAASTDPVARAEAALALVQDRVRYVALSMGEGGLLPADAQTTWARRYGDCKGKTALLLALLHALGIEAEPVAVSVAMGDGLDERLPLVTLFDHVLVRARVAGRTYWLDGTRTGDRRLESLPVPPFRWGLPLVRQGAALVRLIPPPLDRPNHVLRIEVDASAGFEAPAPARTETIARGDQAIALNLALASLTAEMRDQALRDYWRRQFDDFEIRSTEASFDQATGEQRLLAQGTMRLSAAGGTYASVAASLGSEADFSRQPGPGADAPFAIAYPFYTSVTETLRLPPDQQFRVLPEAAVEETIAGVEYRRRASLLGNVLTIEASERSVAPEFPASEAAAAERALRAIVGRANILARAPNARASAAQIAAALARTPDGPRAYLERGVMLLNAGRYREALTDFDEALEAAPRDAWALANRGITRVWLGDHSGAIADLDAAAAIDPRNPVVFRARGLMAEHRGRLEESIAAFTTAIEIEPNNSFAFGHRAEVYRRSGDYERALADAARAIELQPSFTGMYILRARALHATGRAAEAAAQAAALVEANPQDAGAHVTAALLYDAFGSRDEASRAIERAIALRSEPSSYVVRSELRPQEDRNARRADIEAALRLDPRSAQAHAAMARLSAEGGDHEAAIRSWTAAIEAEPEDLGLLINRGVAYLRSGQAALGEADHATVRSRRRNDATVHNNICWAKATAGVALDSALADCNAALALEPEAPAFLDSRALVFLRLGRFDEAIADYDRALAAAPRQPPSLFGRAIAWSRKGDRVRADADAAAAERNDPTIRRTFERYGVRF
jgi:tetratricopeptide (TPR) repeat protein/transglutaminase-like putative cysteine protease